MGGASSLISPSLPSSLKDYKIHSVVGKGGYATIYRTKAKYSSSEIAIKRTQFAFSHLAFDVEMSLVELQALKRVRDHSFITKVRGAFHIKHCCYLLMDYQSGGDLRYHLKTFTFFTEQQVAYFISCLGSALHHLHLRGILHRDIKPENILLTSEGIPKLTDFGSSYIEESYSVPICDSSSGTLAYMAPEALTRSRYHSYQSDYWSLGITAYELLFNCRPFFTHCPLEFIHYAGNQYQCLWSRILLEEGMEVSRRNCNHPCDKNVDLYMNPLYDFHRINESITQEERQAECPFPSASLPDDEFIINIPDCSHAGVPISSECFNFLQSLLDVRVPKRLGQISQFHLFSNHQWFCHFNYQKSIPSTSIPFETTAIAPSSLSQSSLKKPFQPLPSEVEIHLKEKFRYEIVPTDLLSLPNDDEIALPENLIKKLEKYQLDPHSFSKSTQSQDRCSTAKKSISASASLDA
jgi:serine/threonine protein kinase